MKKILLAMVLGVLTTASAAIWQCDAYSSSAYGWARGYNLITVEHRALRECRIRTPFDEVCVITNCYIVN